MGEPIAGSAIHLAAEPISVRQARGVLRTLTGGKLPESLVDDAQLLVSELVTNALRHGGPEIRMWIDLVDGGVRVRVYDSGAGRPAKTEQTDDPVLPSGRGLHMVDRVATEWGVEDGPVAGKTVWFLLRDEQD